MGERKGSGRARARHDKESACPGGTRTNAREQQKLEHTTAGWRRCRGGEFVEHDGVVSQSQFLHDSPVNHRGNKVKPTTKYAAAGRRGEGGGALRHTRLSGHARPRGQTHRVAATHCSHRLVLVLLISTMPVVSTGRGFAFGSPLARHLRCDEADLV